MKHRRCYKSKCTLEPEFRCNCVSPETVMCQAHMGDHASIKGRLHNIQSISRVDPETKEATLNLLYEEISKIKQLKEESLSVSTQIFSSLGDLLKYILQAIDMNLQEAEQKLNKVVKAEKISELETDQLLRSLLSGDMNEAKKICVVDEKTFKNVNALNRYIKNFNEKMIELNVKKSKDIAENDIEGLITKLYEGDLKISQAQLNKAQGFMKILKINEFSADLISPEEIEVLKNSGSCLFSDNFAYFGELNDENQPHGKGKMICNDGGIYEGYWKAGKLHGKGKRIFPTGDLYIGDWVEGKRQGKGRMEFSYGKIYYGDWVNNKEEGFGVDTWFDSSIYTGDFRDGHKEGKGTFVWADGSHYEGDFSNDQIEGVGKYVWAERREYEGAWKCNKMHGKGLFKWEDGRYYNGNYVMDQKEGYGIFGWPNGKRYEGYWLNGKQHGEGTLFNESGKWRKRFWENGKLAERQL